MPEWVMERMTCLLGCEVCQNVCPLNHFMKPRPMTPAEQEAFAFEKLLAGDVKPALEIIGKNMKKGGKLTAQAAVLAANQNRTDLLPLLELHPQSAIAGFHPPFEARRCGACRAYGALNRGTRATE